MAAGLSFLFAVILLASAVGHVVAPDFYAPMIPDFIPEVLANVLATITEVAVAIALILPKYRAWGGLGFMLLMLAFLPIHVWDLFKDTPAIGSPAAAVVRLVIQFLMIYAGWWIWKKYAAR